MNDSDASAIVIEVLCTNFCRRLPVVYDHTMWTVVVRCQVNTVSVTGVKTAAMLWTEFPEIRHKYILHMCIILRPLCREFNSLQNKCSL